MGRINQNDGQELLYQDINKIGALLEREFYDRVIREVVQRTTDAFFGDSLKVSFVDGTHVSVASGSGFQLDSAQVSPEPTKRLIFNPSSVSKVLSTPDVTNPRIDIVCVKAARTNSLTESRFYKDAVTDVISMQSLVTETDWLADIIVVAGTPAASPSAPATPAGYLRIATLAVAAGTGLAGAGSITDNRALLGIGENTQIDTSGFSAVPTRAVGTILKTVLSQLDALVGTNAATILTNQNRILAEYDAIVGAATHCTDATLAAAITRVSAGARILVLDSFALNSAVTVNKDNIEVELKPGVTLSKGSATKAFDVANPGFRLRGGKISGFSGGSDVAVNLQVAATSCVVAEVRFASNTTDVNDAAGTAAIYGCINE